MTVIITIDGTSGSGKGTIASRLAAHFGYHLLDSGAIYRLLGLAARQHGLLDRQPVEAELAGMAASLPIRFELVATSAGQTQVCAFLDNDNVESLIRQEQAGMDASTVAAFPLVRQALLQRQRDMAQPPGLVADGRDMGTVVFPQADAKIYLTASAEVRASRRLRQLQEQGRNATLSQILRDIEQRDFQDMNRPVAPLRPAAGALQLDATDMDIDQVLQRCLTFIAGQTGQPITD